MLLGNILDERDDLEGSGRIQTRRRLVQEEQFGASNELCRDTNTAFLTTGDTFPNRSTDKVVGLTRETKSCEECLDTLDAFKLAD